MSKIRLNLQLALPAIAAIAFGCAQQPAPVSPQIPPTTAQADSGQASVAADGTNDYTVLARDWRGKGGSGRASVSGGHHGGSSSRQGGGGAGRIGHRASGGAWTGHHVGGSNWTGHHVGGSSWTGNRGGGNWTGHQGGTNWASRRGGAWTGHHGEQHAYAYGNHWQQNYGWWGHEHNYSVPSWWGVGNWWTFGGVPWWGLGYEPSWLSTASLVPSQFVYIGGLYYPFYNIGGTIYPDFSRPFIFNGVTYVPYTGATPMVPNQGASLPWAEAQIVNAPASTISD